MTPRHLRAQDVLKLKVPDDATKDERDEAARIWRAARRYFHRFAFVPTREGGNIVSGGVDCIKCGHALNGFLGSFTYGIRHGEGRCSECGWPARTHHYVKGDDGAEVLTLTRYLLQYHPDVVEERP